MATSIGTTKYTDKPKYLTPEYEVERDGRSMLCQMVAYRGHIYEMCRECGGQGDVFTDLVPEPFIRRDDLSHEDVTSLLNDSSSVPGESTVE